jgi:hypothetical protein
MTRARRLALLLALPAALAAGCGSGGDARDEGAPAPRADREPPPAQPAPEARPTPPPDAGGLPRDVPTVPTGPAPKGAEKVIRTWAAAVRAAEMDRAAGTFAIGARVQNGGPVERLRTRASAVRWNTALPCGATVTSVRGSRGYAIVEFQLAERSGALCAGGRGAAAFGAIRVRDGRITDWFRLPDPVAPPGTDAPTGPFV